MDHILNIEVLNRVCTPMSGFEQTVGREHKEVSESCQHALGNFVEIDAF